MVRRGIGWTCWQKWWIGWRDKVLNICAKTILSRFFFSKSWFVKNENLTNIDDRYFECRPKYGLFAPLHKVSRSPSSRRTSSTCILHKPVSSLMTTPPGRLSGSRESVKSTSSRMGTAGSSAIRGMAPGSRVRFSRRKKTMESRKNLNYCQRQGIPLGHFTPASKIKSCDAGEKKTNYFEFEIFTIF